MSSNSLSAFDFWNFTASKWSQMKDHRMSRMWAIGSESQIWVNSEVFGQRPWNVELLFSSTLETYSISDRCCCPMKVRILSAVLIHWPFQKPPISLDLKYTKKMQGNLISLETPCHCNFLRSFLQIGQERPEVIQASRHVACGKPPACCEPLNVSPILLSQTVVFKAQIIGPQ